MPESGCKHGAVSALTLGRIQDDDEARQYISDIDFTQLKSQFLCGSQDKEGLGWSQDKADAVESLFKEWLYLKRVYYGELVPPDFICQDLWQIYLKDSIKYVTDTSAIFGQYLHHFPYFGIGDKQEKKRREVAFLHTKSRYKELFGKEWPTIS
ncbi:hypothetical protein [Thalassobaculum litoreum]|uniref:hypothetical protein n=1 Tax=Thalassobaculum litoreum TaxID=420996 RepID=UPI00111350D5|nr:hypothetical protein [Thalassobaculum litoreum]